MTRVSGCLSGLGQDHGGTFPSPSRGGEDGGGRSLSGVGNNNVNIKSILCDMCHYVPFHIVVSKMRALDADCRNFAAVL